MGIFPIIIVVAVIAFRLFKVFYKLANRVENSSIEKVMEELKRRAVSNPSTAENYEPFQEVVKAKEKPIQRQAKSIYPTHEPVSLEITEAPYSNLEEGILDDVHKSKLPHHQQIKVKKTSKNSKPKLLDNISLQQAFKYSIIFDRKHF